MVKEFLSQKGIGFIDKDVSRDQAAAQEMVNKSRQMGVPVTLINGETIIGFDKPRLEQALARNQAARGPSLGAAVADAGKITAQQGVATLGAYVGRVKPGSVAEKLGLKAGDIILEVNLQNIANTNELENALSALKRGSRFSVVFLRGNNKFTGEAVYQ